MIYITLKLLFVAGNETCPTYAVRSHCQFLVMHYFREPSLYTVLIIIRNDVSKIVTKVGINVYEGERSLLLFLQLSLGSCIFFLEFWILHIDAWHVFKDLFSSYWKYDECDFILGMPRWPSFIHCVHWSPERKWSWFKFL